MVLGVLVQVLTFARQALNPQSHLHAFLTNVYIENVSQIMFGKDIRYPFSFFVSSLITTVWSYTFNLTMFLVCVSAAWISACLCDTGHMSGAFLTLPPPIFQTVFDWPVSSTGLPVPTPPPSSGWPPGHYSQLSHRCFCSNHFTALSHHSGPNHFFLYSAFLSTYLLL